MFMALMYSSIDAYKINIFSATILHYRNHYTAGAIEHT